MKVTQVAICPSEASVRAGRPALTPELLAASGARYSRNNEGLESILSKIDPSNLEKSVDSIFRMVDYGHQSIADMVPVALFIDNVSIWLAYYVWSLCPTAGGQESSTRYLRLSVEGLVPPQELGIPASQSTAWLASMTSAFQAYQTALDLWDSMAQANPALTGIPRSLLQDPSDASQRKVQRMRRNYAFDRARYFLPVSAATNLMLIMSARAWVQLCQYLLSHPLPECIRLGELIRSELEISAPRMVKHARYTESNRLMLTREFGRLVGRAERLRTRKSSATAQSQSAQPYLTVFSPEGLAPGQIAEDLAFHDNRYAPIGTGLQRMGVRFGWSAIGFAEIRDLNRHRTGSKYCPMVPQGFYHALDQLPDAPSSDAQRDQLRKLSELGQAAAAKASQLLEAADPTYIYWALLGTEFPFEHVTTADKFIYEAELRTGLGAHYRYAKHLRDVLGLWYAQFPETRKLILEGSAEPE